MEMISDNFMNRLEIGKCQKKFGKPIYHCRQKVVKGKSCRQL